MSASWKGFERGYGFPASCGSGVGLPTGTPSSSSSGNAAFSNAWSLAP